MSVKVIMEWVTEIIPTPRYGMFILIALAQIAGYMLGSGRRRG